MGDITVMYSTIRKGLHGAFEGSGNRTWSVSKKQKIIEEKSGITCTVHNNRKQFTLHEKEKKRIFLN